MQTELNFDEVKCTALLTPPFFVKLSKKVFSLKSIVSQKCLRSKDIRKIIYEIDTVKFLLPQTFSVSKLNSNTQR